jgi:hypothetical protein
LVSDLVRAGYLMEVLIPEASSLTAQTLHNSRLQRRFDVDGLELQRGAEIFSAPLADRVLQAADLLVLRCNKETLLRLQQEQTVILSPANEQEEAIEDLPQPAVTAMRMVEVLLPIGSTLAGTSYAICASASATTPTSWRCDAATRCCASCSANWCCWRSCRKTCPPPISNGWPCCWRW